MTKTTVPPTTEASANLPQPSGVGESLAATFSPFEWKRPPAGATVAADLAAEFAGRMRDLTGGAAVALALLERDQLAEDTGGAPMLERPDAGALLRLCLTAATMAAEEAERFMDNPRGLGRFA